MEKPDWIIQAEQDQESFKDTPLCKFTTEQLNSMAVGIKCNNCGRKFSKLSISIHVPKCKEIFETVKVLYEEGLSTYEIADKIGMSRTNVNVYFKLNGWTSNKSNYVRQEEKEKLFLEVYNSNPNISQIELSKKTGINYGSVGRLYKKYNLEYPRAKAAKVRKEKMEKAVQLHKQGLDNGEIAEKIGLTRKQVSKELNNRGLTANKKPV